ncbi:glycosyl hydrolase family 17 [Sphingobacteriales bacterium UPWRP_1]|nr:glycosyl hydrolase family 17 [Sphingobacteriales bacterium TSM_CSM]PSJ76128.1 glycosyl hydrolase family 17 [Sphingobacteriales bacterium UPWRP_1]
MLLLHSCRQAGLNKPGVAGTTAANILGNPAYLAISYGGYRQTSRDVQPTVAELKEDMKLLAAMGIKLLRTYNVYLEETSNLLKAITQLKQENPQFEMYLMLGAWIDCKNAFTDNPDHQNESERNEGEIARAVALAKQYPDIVKIIAVGNEAMVKWAASYYVQPGVILKWVKYLQDLKAKGELPADLWITSSDNFASWGGGDAEYHVEDLNNLIKAVDFISMHTYPMHDTHYNPDFWGVRNNETNLTELEKTEAAMHRAKNYAIAQYQSVVQYMKSLGVNKPVHIGETGWATQSNERYGDNGSRATDEYKSGIYYHLMREWTNQSGLTLFYFEAFDEQWKDAGNPGGSENHFGLFTVQGQAKYAIWDVVDKGVFSGLTRNGNPITKTFNGNKAALMKTVKTPHTDAHIKALQPAH